MRWPAVVVATALLTSGCGGFAGLSDVSLPGGPELGDEPMTVTIEARDVLSLSRQASVKVDDVTIGEVENVRRVGWHAEVDLRLREGTELPANTVVAVRQTGLLGEKYVELAPPAAPEGKLRDGDRIPLDRSSRSVEVEEVLSALSLLLNGGGLERLRTITVELNKALGGREGEFRSLLTRLDSFTGTLAENRRSIVAAIDGLDRLSAQAADGQRTIAAALDRLGPALKVLADQRKDLVRMLGATSRLAQVGTRTVVRVREDLVANLDALAPTLTRLSEAGESIPGALQYALTFPFPTEAMQALRGDYFNFDMEIQIRELDLLQLLGIVPNSPANPQGPAAPLAPGLQLPGLPQLPLLSGAQPIPNLLQQLLGGL